MIDIHSFQNKKAAYFTLGCKLNFAETSTIGKILADSGIRKILPGEKADICVVNTCSVTELADKKSRQMIRKISKEHPDAFIVVTGCYAQLKPDEVSGIEGVDLVLGSNQKLDIVQYLEDKEWTKTKVGNKVLPVNDTKVFVPSCSSDDRTRHFLKVQDGCDYFCSYCTIPFARGRSRNGKIAELVAMAREVGEAGGREIVLTGVNIGDFGKTTGETFRDLIIALDEVESIDRYRISSIEPNLLSDEIIEFVAKSKRFAPHFHIPLQSGSDEVLKIMRRRYDTELFASKIHKIKELMPDAFIGVDVIVGVRGETDEYFDEAERFLESLPISQLHVFAYSERPGTMALKVEHKVDAKTKHERSKRLLNLSERKTREFYQSQTGTEHAVIFEHSKKGGKMHGFTENYIKVKSDYDIRCINKLFPVILKNLDEEDMTFTI